MSKLNKTNFMTENIIDSSDESMEVLCTTTTTTDESQFIEDSLKGNKTTQKRQHVDTDEEDDNSFSAGQCQANMKKKKIDPSIDGWKESRQKLLNVMSRQVMSRKQRNDSLMKNLSEVLAQMEDDYNVLKENQQKLEYFTRALLTYVQQATNAYKQKLKSLRDIHTSFMKECEELDAGHQKETSELAEELGNDIKKSQQKLITDTKRKGWETLRKTIFQVMQNDF